MYKFINRNKNYFWLDRKHDSSNQSVIKLQISKKCYSITFALNYLKHNFTISFYFEDWLVHLNDCKVILQLFALLLSERINSRDSNCVDCEL